MGDQNIRRDPARKTCAGFNHQASRNQAWKRLALIGLRRRRHLAPRVKRAEIMRRLAAIKAYQISRQRAAKGALAKIIFSFAKKTRPSSAAARNNNGIRQQAESGNVELNNCIGALLAPARRRQLGHAQKGAQRRVGASCASALWRRYEGKLGA